MSLRTLTAFFNVSADIAGIISMSLRTYNFCSFVNNYKLFLYVSMDIQLFYFFEKFQSHFSERQGYCNKFRKNIDEREPFFCGISFFFIHKTFCNFAPTGIPYTAPSDRAFSGGQGAGLIHIPCEVVNFFDRPF